MSKSLVRAPWYLARTFVYMNVLIFKHPFVPNEMSDKKTNKQTNKKQVDWDDMPGYISVDFFT